jgi:hypothetical protein
MKRWLTTGIAVNKMSPVSAPIYRSHSLKPVLFAALAAVLVWEVTSRTFVVIRRAILTPRIASSENVTQVTPLALAIRRWLIDCSLEISECAG